MGLAVGTSVGAVQPLQLGSGIVYDPTNYHNALLRYYQLQKHLIQLQKTYTQDRHPNYNLACRWHVSPQHAHPLPRVFSQWRNVTALNTYGNTNGWIAGINTGNINGQQAISKRQPTCAIRPTTSPEWILTNCRASSRSMPL